ncbi:unknown [Prevotella sp. CAG:474]|nr:unknown [Prevotella sp. CAG:474]
MKILIKIIWWIYNNQVKIIIRNNIQTIKQVSIDNSIICK